VILKVSVIESLISLQMWLAHEWDKYCCCNILFRS